MTRTGAHFIYINSAKILQNGVIEYNKQGIIRNIFSLDDCRSETAQTIFLNGIIVPLRNCVDDFKLKIRELQKQNPNATVFELFAKMNLSSIEINKKIKLIVIENIDFEKKQMTEKSVFRAL